MAKTGNKTKANDINVMLNGFEFVSAHSIPTITLDNQFRLYLNTSTRRLLDVVTYERLAIAYKADSYELAIVKSSAGLDDKGYAEFLTSNFVVDKRYYLHVKQLMRLYNFSIADAPYHFEYERGKSDGSVFIFALR